MKTKRDTVTKHKQYWGRVRTKAKADIWKHKQYWVRTTKLAEKKTAKTKTDTAIEHK